MPVNTTISINGILTVDGNYTLSNWINPANTSVGIRFAPTSSVIIPSGKSLTISNSYLFANSCSNQMWQGIFVYPGGSLTTTGNTLIADAIVAVNGVGSSIGMLNLNNTRFYRDWVGVNIPAYTNYTGTIIGCSFSYNATDPLQNYMLAPHLNSRMAVGIFANNMAGNYWNIGGTTTTPNTFTAINNGIYAYHSNVKVNNNSFDQIGNYNNVNPSSGNAVYAIGIPSWGNLWVQTNTNSLPPAFTNCACGVYVNSNNAVVANNNMINCPTGIFAVGCGLNSLDFNTNIINGTYAGITFNSVNSTIVRTLSAIGNNITVNEPAYFAYPNVSYPNPYGIGHLENTATGFTCTDGTRNCRVLIENNTIYHGRYGIYMNNAYGTRVTFNNIYQNNTASTNGLKAGIYASGCLAPLITQNQLFGNGNTYDETATNTVNNRRNGVVIYNSTNAELCSNTFTSLGYAMQFQAGCGGTLLKNNVMNGTGTNGYRYGIVLKKVGVDGVIGEQGSASLSHGNSFSGYFNNTSGYKTYTFQSNANPYPFRINNYTSNAVQPWPNGADVANNEIRKGNASSPNPWLCSTGAGIWKSLIVNQGDLYARVIAEGEGAQFVEEGLEQSGTWLLEKDLYERLKENPAMLNSKQLYQDFYEAKDQTSIGDINRYEEALLTLTDTTLANDSASLAAQVQSVMAVNNQIQAGTDYEQNRHWVNDLYLRTAAQGNINFSLAERQQLYSLANQCPYAAGDAVYIARTLYNLIDHNEYFNDEELCATAAAFKREQAKKNMAQTFSVSVSPNPASNIVDVVIKGSKQDMQLVVYNTFGQVMGEALVNGFVELDIADFPNGIYQLAFTNLAGEKYTTRLVVSK